MKRHHSRRTVESLTLLGRAVRIARKQRRWTISELAERLGVSERTAIKIEHGDPTVSIGTVFEAADLVGVALFSDDPVERRRYGTQQSNELALLPQSTRRRRKVDNDF